VACETLTRVEAARLLGCSKETIDRMRRAGRLPSIKLGERSVRIPRWAVEELLRYGQLNHSGDTIGRRKSLHGESA